MAVADFACKGPVNVCCVYVYVLGLQGGRSLVW